MTMRRQPRDIGLMSEYDDVSVSATSPRRHRVGMADRQCLEAASKPRERERDRKKQTYRERGGRVGGRENYERERERERDKERERERK